ncbi:MAG: hypothetical protein LC113_13715 [Acidobacteria bacterium]|nr:hypothetical protein [Acidobacteriota bacterium]
MFILFSSCACSVNEGGSKSYRPAISSVCFIDRGNIWLVSYKGELIHLENGRVAEPKFTNEGAAVDFINKDVGWMLLQTGSLLQTLNGGLDWKEIGRLPSISAGGKPFRTYPLDLRFVDDRVGWITASTNILRSEDGGRTWSVWDFHDANVVSGMMIVDQREIWAVTKTAKVFHTVDGGQNWEVKQLPSIRVGDESYPRSIAIDRTGRIWVGNLRSRSTVAVSSDGGQTWSEREMPVMSDILRLTAIQFAPDGTGRAAFALISKGDAPTQLSLLISENNGDTWEVSHDVKLPFRPVEINFVSDTEGYLISASDIAVTKDAGATWQILFSLESGN